MIFLEWAGKENLDKYDAYMNLCKAVGLPMLIDGTERNYMVDNGVLYYMPAKRKTVYSRNPREIMLFENLLAIKSIL